MTSCIRPLQTDQDVAMSLTDVFEDFISEKESLQDIHKKTLECLNKIEVSLSQTKYCEREISPKLKGSELVEVTHQGASNAQSEQTEITNLRECLYTHKEQEEVTSLFSQRPSLIVVGQTNCGKSSIINEFLGHKALPTLDGPCTARVIRMTYSENPFVRLLGKDGFEIQPQMNVQNNKILRSLIQLNQQERKDKDRVIEIVEAGLNLGFLKSGVDIIDTPGINENLVLDEVISRQLDNILPFIIYVIDGHNLLCSPDIDVLNNILKEREGLEIFYVVNKIEPEESDIDENEDIPSNEEPVQESKKRRVYDKLVKNNFLAPDGKTMHSHENFHGLSAWKIKEYNGKKKKDPQWDDPEGVYTEYNEAFKRFQTCLQRFSESSLKACTERPCQILIEVLSRCVNLFFQKAKVMEQSIEATLAMIEKIRHEENEIHIKLLERIDEKEPELVEVVEGIISELEEAVITEAQKFHYSDLVFENTPKGQIRRTNTRHCLSELRQIVINMVQERMKDVLTHLFARSDEMLKDLEKQVKKVEEETFSDVCGSAVAVCSISNLIWCYELTESYQPNERITLPQRIKNFFREFVLNRPMDAINPGTVNLDDSEWKQRQALNTLKAMNVDSMVSNLIEAVKSNLNENHEKFKEEFTEVRHVFEGGASLRKHEQVKVIHKFVPDIAIIEMLCHSFKDRLKYGQPEEGEVIGCGSQTTGVYICDNITTPEGKPCVVKVVPVPDEKALKDLAVELHYTRYFDHPNILPLVCTIIKHGMVFTEPFIPITVFLVSERIKSDLHVALPNILSLGARLKILLDVAQALQYLHKQGLMHRDVKMQNVLVDDENRGRLTDMGLCKPEILAEGTIVGTPTFMAPEIIFSHSKYSKDVDVYAFGILMWCVCEGQGNTPQNIILHRDPMIMLEENAKRERKPEKLDTFLEPCWQLMKRCWATETEFRPSFDAIVNELNEILKDIVE